MLLFRLTVCRETLGNLLSFNPFLAIRRPFVSGIKSVLLLRLPILPSKFGCSVFVSLIGEVFWLSSILDLFLPLLQSSIQYQKRLTSKPVVLEVRLSHSLQGEGSHSPKISSTGDLLENYIS